MSDKDVCDAAPLGFWDERGEPEPIKKQCARINGNSLIAGLNQEGIISIKFYFHVAPIILAGLNLHEIEFAKLIHRITIAFPGVYEQIQWQAIYRSSFVDSQDLQITDVALCCGDRHTHSFAPDLEGFYLANWIIVFGGFGHK
jgi:hypothetical protein